MRKAKKRFSFVILSFIGVFLSAKAMFKEFVMADEKGLDNIDE